MRHLGPQAATFKKWKRFFKKGLPFFTVCFLRLEAAAGPTAESYDPAWISELIWTGGNGQSGNIYSAPTGSWAWVEEAHAPWWQTRVAHPVRDYDSSELPIGSVRLDTALDVELTGHKLKKSWTVASSPSGINNVYTFTPGSESQDDFTARSGQNAHLNLGFHPTTNLMGDIGIEVVGNYDQRFYFPISHEHRLYKDKKHIGITRSELKYDIESFMIRGFQGVPFYGWVAENDLFQLLPTQLDVENYRRVQGMLTPRGGQMRYATGFGSIDVLGGTEPRFGFGPSVYVKYDAPTRASWENSVVYRNEEVPFSLDPDDDRRWTVSYNSSWKPAEAMSSHVGLLYQPFRLGYRYSDEDGRSRRTLRRDALGATWRVEARPVRWVETAGLGYTYLGPVAGNKHQIDFDASQSFQPGWAFSGAYLYRTPILAPVPLRYEGTPNNPGALITSPRGPDDPFWVQWDNREAHVASLTLLYDPTPETYFWRYQKNILEEWNVNPDEDSAWAAAVQYRLAYYPTNTDRMYRWDEDRNVIWDPIFADGALATSYPFSSATGLLRWQHRDGWGVTADLSGGQALAGSAIAYTSATDFYKPSTTFVHGGVALHDGPFKVFGRYGQDIWGPEDYHIQQGWTYHKVYQAGVTYNFLRDFQSGFRYTGTRMTEDFIGSDTGAFNEYRLYLTYHFGRTWPLGKKFELRGKQP